MASSLYSHHRHGRGLLMLALVASFATVVVTSQSQDNNGFTEVDCQSSAPSRAPSPSTSSSNSSTNSTFWSNVVALLDALPSAAAPTGFASRSRGTGGDRAFVRGICRGDSTPADCATYLKRAAQGIISRCNSSNSRRAGIWYGMSSVTYADTNASTAHEQQYRSILYNVNSVSNQDAFENTYDALMSRLAQRVVNGSGSGTGTTSASIPVAPMFATGEAVYDSDAPNGTMYGMLQCMRDRMPEECNQCLQVSNRQLSSCCYGHQGGVVFGYDCKLRVEIYPYYDLALDAPPPPVVPAPAPSSFAGESQGKKATHLALVVVLPVATGLVAGVVVIGVFLCRRNGGNRKKTDSTFLLMDMICCVTDKKEKEGGIRYVEPEQFNIAMLRDATNNFSEENKHGEGGFGEVFKGTLQDGEEIAVKKLSQNSSQGFHEHKNELVLAAKLKHRNLVQLLGVCLQEEKLLVYEYMPNRSLDTFLFGIHPSNYCLNSKRKTHTHIILYLYICSFCVQGDPVRKQRLVWSRRGYMSPEYAYWGHVSTKSDMFSFGVIVLEMVWDKWRAGSALDVLDPLLAESQYPENEVLNCIEIGLLCVQENPADRPDASTVVLMLSGPASTPDDRRIPSRPAFVFSSGVITESTFARAGAWNSKQPSTAAVSENEVSISELEPR
nr:unnamed protein product [Digitaria exilis]